MAGQYEAIRSRGADVAAIGTGNARLARDFIQRDRIPFPVLLDEDALAARAAGVERVGALALFDRRSFAGTARAWRAGHRIGVPGKRTNQLGATFVLGAGSLVRYAHWDAHTADHAPLDQVLAALDD